MIFWVMLLTFVVSIMTLALYPREDMVNVQEKPLAEVPVRPFIDMHQMARQIAAAKVATGRASPGEILKGSDLPLYNQEDVGDFKSYLICQTLTSTCDLSTGTCTLRREIDTSCTYSGDVICFNSKCEERQGQNPPYDCSNTIKVGACDDQTDPNGQTWMMNFVLTYAPYNPDWNSINNGPNGSVGQLWNGELYRLSGKSGNCGVVAGSEIVHPGDNTPINTNVKNYLRNNYNVTLEDGSMICQSPVPKYPENSGYEPPIGQAGEVGNQMLVCPPGYSYVYGPEIYCANSLANAIRCCTEVIAKRYPNENITGAENDGNGGYSCN